MLFVRQVDNSRMLIGQISLDSKADWETLQNTISDTFKVRKTQLYTSTTLRRNTVQLQLLIALLYLIYDIQYTLTDLLPVSHAPNRKRAVPQHSTILEVPFYLCTHPLPQHFDVVTNVTVGSCLFYGFATPSLQGAGLQRSPILEVPFCLCVHPFVVELPNLKW